MQDHLNEFKEHGELIKEFNRDPRRNQLLERENTAKEDEYLQQF